jgi:hypothetical protein
VLGLLAWVVVYGIGFESEIHVLVALVATLASVVLGVIALRWGTRYSREYFTGIAGVGLGGLILLQAALVIVFSLLGWMEWR